MTIGLEIAELIPLYGKREYMLGRIRRELGFYVTDVETRGGRFTSLLLYVLNFTFLALYVSSTFPLGEAPLTVIRYTEVGIALVFAVEYFIRLDVAENRWKAIRDPYMVADALAVFPALLLGLPVGFDTGFLRGLHSLRVFRFLRFGFEDGVFFTVEVTPKRLEQIRFITIIILLFFIYAGFIFGAEAGANENINNMGDAIYFSAVTLTTLGYGDILPITTAGRAVTTIFLIIGAILIPWQAFRIRNADVFITDIVCERCGLDDHEGDARWCRRCGYPIHTQEDFIEQHDGRRADAESIEYEDEIQEGDYDEE